MQYILSNLEAAMKVFKSEQLAFWQKIVDLS
jgi:hypothetical protein